MSDHIIHDKERAGRGGREDDLTRNAGGGGSQFYIISGGRQKKKVNGRLRSRAGNVSADGAVQGEGGNKQSPGVEEVNPKSLDGINGWVKSQNREHQGEKSAENFDVQKKRKGGP